MGVDGMKEGVAGQAINSASPGGGIVRTSAAVTANDVVSRIAWVRRIVDAKLRVVENVKSFGTELNVPFA